MTRHSHRLINGFRIHKLDNENVSLSMAPELGGRVVSIRHRTSGREWLDGWSPAKTRRIWKPANPDLFESGPGSGLDECLPTVLPCKVGDIDLPDHGELWNTTPAFDVTPEDGGTLLTHWRLRSLPLALERRIFLRRETIHFTYRLGNLSDTSTPFLWAWHPLFNFKRGDRMLFPGTMKHCHSSGLGESYPWPCLETGNDLSRAEFLPGATPAAKVFLGPFHIGHAEIRSAKGARLILSWSASVMPFAGIWITRGFWKGLHHWAIEPTNSPVDRLSDAGMASPLTSMAPREVRSWSVTVKCSMTENSGTD